MQNLNQWLEGRVLRAAPTLMALALVVLSIALAACGGRGGGSGY